MTISLSGSLSDGNNMGVTSLSVASPVVGNMRILISGLNATTTISSVSGGGVGTWNFKQASGATNGTRIELWWGQITSTGSSTISVTYSSSISGVFNELISQMVSTTTSSPTWICDKSNTTTSSNSSTIAYPTLAPTSGTELYWGYAYVSGTGSNGSTSGFTYGTTSFFSSPYCYNTSVTGSVSPTASQAPSGFYDSVGALFGVSTGTGQQFFFDRIL